MKPALCAALLFACGILYTPAPLPAALRTYRYGGDPRDWHSSVWAYHGIRGKVKKWTEHNYTTWNRNGTPQTVLTSKAVREYDASGRELSIEYYGPKGRDYMMRCDGDGRLILLTRWNEDGSIKDDVRYRYLPEEDRTIREDATGRLLGYSRTVHDKDTNTETDYGYDATGKQVSLAVRIRDEQGRMSKDQHFFDDTLHSETLYSYDAAGNITRISFERDSTRGLLRRTGIFSTDAEGRVLLELKCDGEGRVKEYESLQYNKNKQVDYTIRIAADGKVLEESQAFFDGQGRCVRTLSLREGRTGETRINYNPAGQPVETIFTSSSGATYRTRHVYNSQNQLAEEWIRDGKNTLLSITRYTYDRMGSRCRRTLYRFESGDLWSINDPREITEDTIPSQLTTHELEYHE